MMRLQSLKIGLFLKKITKKTLKMHCTLYKYTVNKKINKKLKKSSSFATFSIREGFIFRYIGDDSVKYVSLHFALKLITW